jgi:hypothetical protein
MSTREKKSKANTDSPTPDSAPTTPTSKGSGSSRGGRSRARGGGRGNTTSQRGTPVSAQNTNEGNESSSDEDAQDKPLITSATSNKTDSPAKSTKASTEEAIKDDKVTGIEEIKIIKDKDKEKDEKKDKDKEKDDISSAPVTPSSTTKRQKELEAKKAKQDNKVPARRSRAADAAVATVARSARKKAADAEKLRKAGGIVKRKSLPNLEKKGRAANTPDRRNSTTKIDKLKDTIAKEAKKKPNLKKGETEENKSLRSGKPRDGESPMRKRRRELLEKDEPTTKAVKEKQIKLEKIEKNETETDSDTTKLERSRSDSVSTKCSDITDISSFNDKEGTPNKEATSSGQKTEVPNIKKETIDLPSAVGDNDDDEKVMCKSKVLDKMAESFEKKMNEAVSMATIIDSKNIRRSTRARKSTFKEKEKEAATAPKTKLTEIKTEPVVASVASESDTETDEISQEIIQAKSNTPTSIPLTVDTEKIPPLHIETSETNAASSETDQPATAKEAFETPEQQSPTTTQASLSPQLVSEGVSVNSVKQFYTEPAFLENNLGIEQDPKLAGELVQAHEKNKIETTEKFENDKEEKLNHETKVEIQVKELSSDDKLEITKVEKQELKEEKKEPKDEKEQLKTEKKNIAKSEIVKTEESASFKSEPKKEFELTEITITPIKKVETEVQAKPKISPPTKKEKTPTKAEQLLEKPIMAPDEVKLVIGVPTFSPPKRPSPEKPPALEKPPSPEKKSSPIKILETEMEDVSEASSEPDKIEEMKDVATGLHSIDQKIVNDIEKPLEIDVTESTIDILDAEFEVSDEFIIVIYM